VIRICAWCQQEGKSEMIGTIPEELHDQVSHGICQDHGLRLRASFKRNLLDRHTESTTLPWSLASLRT